MISFLQTSCYHPQYSSLAKSTCNTSWCWSALAVLKIIASLKRNGGPVSWRDLFWPFFPLGKFWVIFLVSFLQFRSWKDVHVLYAVCILYFFLRSFSSHLCRFWSIYLPVALIAVIKHCFQFQRLSCFFSCFCCTIYDLYNYHVYFVYFFGVFFAITKKLSLTVHIINIIYTS